MSAAITIHVRLLDEAVDVWRPVLAEHLDGDAYRIIEQAYDRLDERWQFEPGAVVRCEEITLSEGRVLAATRRDLLT